MHKGWDEKMNTTKRENGIWSLKAMEREKGTWTNISGRVGQGDNS